MVILSKSEAYFAAPHLSKIIGAKLYVMETEGNGFFGLNTNTNGIYCGDNFEFINDEDIIIIGLIPLKKISDNIKKFKRVISILCDTPSITEYKWWNKFIKENNIELYIMPDLIQYCYIDYKPILQYIEINEKLIQEKNNILTVSHSPRTNKKMKMKGTYDINKFINKLKKEWDFKFNLISNLKNDEAIKEKSKSHIFIDQLVNKKDYKGGIGKSGLESMILKSSVITSGNGIKTEPFFDSPPIFWTNCENFYIDLKFLISNDDFRNEQIYLQNNWINKYMNKEFYIDYLKI